jgi:hypothetical protein
MAMAMMRAAGLGPMPSMVVSNRPTSWASSTLPISASISFRRQRPRSRSWQIWRA